MSSTHAPTCMPYHVWEMEDVEMCKKTLLCLEGFVQPSIGDDVVMFFPNKIKIKNKNFNYPPK